MVGTFTIFRVSVLTITKIIAVPVSVCYTGFLTVRFWNKFLFYKMDEVLNGFNMAKMRQKKNICSQVYKTSRMGK